MWYFRHHAEFVRRAFAVRWGNTAMLFRTSFLYTDLHNEYRICTQSNEIMMVVRKRRAEVAIFRKFNMTLEWRT